LISIYQLVNQAQRAPVNTFWRDQTRLRVEIKPLDMSQSKEGCMCEKIQSHFHSSRLPNSFKSFNHHHTVATNDLQDKLSFLSWGCKDERKDAFKLLEERQIDVSKHKFHAWEIGDQKFRLGALTTMPISVVSLPLTSNVLSSTRFMNWSNPRKTPTTFRFAFSFTAITTVHRQNMKLSNTALR
jgi:hypothetical protein